MNKNLFAKIIDFIADILFTPSIILIIIWIFVLGLRRVDGVSMYPTLHNGDIIGLYKLEYIYKQPQRGDIVVFKHNNEHFVKRIIGLPGETIEVRRGKVYINGKLLDESAYLPSTVYTTQGNFLIEGVSYLIPKEQYFCMGDNRLNSTDSRDFGPVAKDLIEGKVVFIAFPFQRLQMFHKVSYNIK